MSLDPLDIALGLEARLGVVLSEDEVGYLFVCTVGDLHEIVRQRMRGEAAFVPERVDKLAERIEQAVNEVAGGRPRWRYSLERRIPTENLQERWNALSALLDCPLPELVAGANGALRLPHVARSSWHLAQWLVENHPKRLRPAAAVPSLLDHPSFRLPKFFRIWDRARRVRSADEVARLTDEAIWNELVELLVRVLRVERAAVTPTARLARDLGFS